MSINCTPGPWVPHQPNGRYMGWKVGPAWLGCAESEKNNDRHLISAALELLEALDRLSAQCERMRMPGQPMSDAEKTARAAIAKAKGQS